MAAVFKYFSAVCAFALALSGPQSPFLAHAAAHVVEGTHVHEHDGKAHGHEHRGDAHHHEIMQADATPAALSGSPHIDFLRQNQESPVYEFASPAAGSVMAELSAALDTGPPLQPPDLTLSLKPADRAPPA